MHADESAGVDDVLGDVDGAVVHAAEEFDRRDGRRVAVTDLADESALAVALVEAVVAGEGGVVGAVHECGDHARRIGGGDAADEAAHVEFDRVAMDEGAVGSRGAACEHGSAVSDSRERPHHVRPAERTHGVAPHGAVGERAAARGPAEDSGPEMVVGRSAAVNREVLEPSGADAAYRPLAEAREDVPLSVERSGELVDRGEGGSGDVDVVHHPVRSVGTHHRAVEVVRGEYLAVDWRVVLVVVRHKPHGGGRDLASVERAACGVSGRSAYEAPLLEFVEHGIAGEGHLDGLRGGPVGRGESQLRPVGGEPGVFGRRDRERHVGRGLCAEGEGDGHRRAAFCDGHRSRRGHDLHGLLRRPQAVHRARHVRRAGLERLDERHRALARHAEVEVALVVLERDHRLLVVDREDLCEVRAVGGLPHAVLDRLGVGLVPERQHVHRVAGDCEVNRVGASGDVYLVGLHRPVLRIRAHADHGVCAVAV